MHTRENALNEWLETVFIDKPFTLTPLAGDASFRRYFRLHCGGLTRIVMDAPPPKEAIGPFVSIAVALAQVGVHTPVIHAVDHTHGFILLEDLGDRVFLNELSTKTADTLYKNAMDTLSKIQECSATAAKLPVFDKQFILSELTMFREWFLGRYLALTLHSKEEQLLNQTFDWLIAKVTSQPHVFIHRDYHSRNLMVVRDSQPADIGVIDFQDAMLGPYAYDLVSLLKDCYVQWPREQTMQWLAYFHGNLPSAIQGSFAEFNHAFDVCGLQRHLKVLGIFCRLSLRDNKSAYLRDLPLTFHYVMACLEDHSELAPFYQFMQQKVQPIFLEKQS